MPRLKKGVPEKIPAPVAPVEKNPPPVKERHYGLCYRCQHRVDFHETQSRPRMECGDIGDAVRACYMFLPTLPVAVEPSNPDDPRPLFGPPMIAGRVRIAGPVPPAEYYMSAKRVSNGIVVTADILQKGKKKP